MKAFFEEHPEELLDKLYATGHVFFLQKDFSSAIETFNYLTTVNPESKKYWLSLATAQFHFEDFTSALKSYFQVNSLDPIDPLSFFYTSQCFLKIKNYPSAKNCLEKVVELASNDPLSQSLIYQAKKLLQQIKS